MHDLVAQTLADPFAANSAWHFDQLTADPRIATLRAKLATPLAATHGLQEGGVREVRRRGFMMCGCTCAGGMIGLEIMCRGISRGC